MMLMGTDRTAAAETPAAQPTIRRSEADPRPRGADRHPVRAAQRRPVEHAAARDGLRFRHDLLAAVGPLATRGRLETPARRAARRIASPWRSRSGPSRRRQFRPSARCAGEKNWTEPYRSPQGRVEASCSHRRARDSARRDADRPPTGTTSPQLLPLVDAFPPLRGRPGPPVRKPGLIQGDRGYDSQPHRDQLHRRGIRTQLAKRGRPMAAASGAPAGSSSAPWRGCIGFVDWRCAMNVGRACTKPSSPWRAPWYAGTF